MVSEVGINSTENVWRTFFIGIFDKCLRSVHSPHCVDLTYVRVLKFPIVQ